MQSFRSLCLAVLLVTPLSFGAAPVRQQAQAQVLDQAELLCDNCFFGASDYYFCFAADNKILIAYQAIPVMNWQDRTRNYLTKVHRSWTPWAAPGQTVPISYDEKHVWVTRPDGKLVKLSQIPARDVFINNAQCQEAARAKSH